MSAFRDRWRWPLVTLGVVVLVAGVVLAVRDRGEEGGKSEAEREREAEGGEGGEIKDPVKRRYVERANEVCTEAANKWTEAGKEIFPGEPTRISDAQLRRYLDRVVPILREMLEELRRVPAKPPGDEARIDAWYDYSEGVLARMERLRRNPSSERLRRSVDTYGGYLKNLPEQNYGLEACGQED